MASKCSASSRSPPRTRTTSAPGRGGTQISGSTRVVTIRAEVAT